MRLFNRCVSGVTKSICVFIVQYYTVKWKIFPSSNFRGIRGRLKSAKIKFRGIIIIIIISIFKEDNVFSISASLPYGPLLNTDID